MRLRVNVAAYFRDPDGDPLTYTAATSNGGVVTAAVSGQHGIPRAGVGGNGDGHGDGARPGGPERDPDHGGDG